CRRRGPDPKISETNQRFFNRKKIGLRLHPRGFENNSGRNLSYQRRPWKHRLQTAFAEAAFHRPRDQIFSRYSLPSKNCSAMTENRPKVTFTKAEQNIDAANHVSGRSVFVDDLPLLNGTLHVKAFGSPVAHGKIKNLDFSEAEQLEGV